MKEEPGQSLAGTSLVLLFLLLFSFFFLAFPLVVQLVAMMTALCLFALFLALLALAVVVILSHRWHGERQTNHRREEQCEQLLHLGTPSGVASGWTVAPRVVGM